MLIFVPISLDNAFGAFVNDNICNTLKHIPSNSWKLFLCSTVEINEDTLDSFGFSLNDNFRFGDSVANIGDLDGDGVNDLAVGAKRDDASGGNDRGAVYILFMNTDGSPKDITKIDHFTPNGPTLRNVDRFGDSIANMGDLNGDGINDLAVGAVNDDTNSHNKSGGANWDAGAVHILFLNRDGSLARATAVINDFTTNGPVLAEGDAFGMGVANIGDLDGNGYDDLAASAMKDHANDRGAVHILFMDENGGLAKATEIIDGTTTNGPTLGNNYWFGGSVANIGDFDGNGVDDLAVGANLCCGGTEDKGALYILFMDEDPGNGLAKATVVIDDTTTNGPTLSDNDRFGNAVANMGDIDGNGVNDLAVGARLDDEGGSSSGAVHILFMNSDGSVEETIEINSSTDKGPTLSAGDAFGTGLAHIGDLNGDGVNDLVVGADTHDGNGGDNAKRGIVYILFLTYEIEEEKKKSSSCWDCTRPGITHHGISRTADGFSINDVIFENNQELYNKNPTVEATVGDTVTIKARAWDNLGAENIVRVYSYMDMHGEKPDWQESYAFIEYNIRNEKFEVNDKNKIFSLVGASAVVANPYRDNDLLEVLDITFTIIFAKPIEPSHIAIQTIDEARNYELVYFENALKIKEKEIVEMKEIPEPVTEESIPEESVTEESIPEESEPPIKEPEPEVMLTASTEKSVLSFVDENLPAKHYVKRYITEQEYKEWFNVNYPKYQFWKGIGISQDKFEQIKLEIESEPEPKIVQTGFVLVPDDEKSFPLIEETYEPEPPKLEPIKEKKGFWEWLFGLFN